MSWELPREVGYEHTRPLGSQRNKDLSGCFLLGEGEPGLVKPMFGEILVVSLSLPSCTVLGFLFCVRQEES